MGIFEYIKKRKIRTTLDDSWRILNAYGELMSNRTGFVTDESCLPAPKEVIKAALKVQILVAIAAEDEKLLEWARTGYLFLASFQPSVGSQDILPSFATSTVSKEKEQFILFTTRLAEEWHILERELEQLKHEHPSK